MTNPSINELLEKVDNRFMLCIIAGKRARQLLGGAHQQTGVTSYNTITTAANEINENKITYKEVQVKT